jgi:hypothetical protein
VSTFTTACWEDGMKRLCALLVISALAFSGCAANGPAIGGQRVADPPELWRAYTEKLPIGSTVRIRTSDGDSFSASLLAVDGTGVTVKPRTRLSEPTRHVTFDRLDQLEIEPLNSGPGARAGAIAIGVATGVGTFFGAAFIACLIAGCLGG